MKVLACSVLAFSASVATIAAQSGIAPLTPERLAEAVAYGQAHPDDAWSLASPVRIRMAGLDVRRNVRMAEVILEKIQDAPFEFYIASPYAIAAMASATAARKFAPAPVLTVQDLNDRKVVIHVMPGSRFSTADAIENVVIKRDGAVLQPLKKALTPQTVQNGLGASRQVADGDFTFDFDAFAPTTSITIVFVGAGGNYEWTVTPEELAQLR